MMSMPRTGRMADRPSRRSAAGQGRLLADTYRPYEHEPRACVRVPRNQPSIATTTE